MYFFLGNLSAVDITFSTVTIPKLLSCILYGGTSISFLGCFLQLFFLILMGTTESFLLSIMAFDRYLAICKPLRYTSLMTDKVMVMLTSICWIAASLHSILYTYVLSDLKYCEDRLIPHFVFISLFYVPVIFIYFRPSSDHSSQHDRIVSIAYTIITPMLNSFIYSLRNKDVKKGLKKIIIKLFLHS
ncbi:hypothetical protein AB205_0136390 [Aquarana catesbeiana]|uniref:G-protein coupled receptors family 1 profile domain-containing protein n=2 Tax=Aquarana catesbeiana TaxID=8400 RepID=A0A2G9Q3X3_AQUCT|nr:hypothetical protein AB205_0136390 [Aquarana catesbeiana]